MNKNEMIAALKNKEFVAIYRHGEFDEDGFCSGLSKFSHKDITAENIVGSIFCGLRKNEIAEFEESIESVEHIINAYNEANDNTPDFQSILEYKEVYLKKLSEQRRVALESTAANFVRKHKTGGVNIVFIQKLEEEIHKVEEKQSDWNSAENRAERWAVCSNSGNRDAFWEDKDYVNGNFDSESNKLHELMNYIREELPLLWQSYLEFEQKNVVNNSLCEE